MSVEANRAVRSCDLLRSRLFLCFGALLVVQLIAWSATLINTRNLSYHPDFLTFYAAGNLARAGQPALAYDRVAELTAEQNAVGMHNAPLAAVNHFNYPPVFLMLCWGFAQLNMITSMLIFEGCAIGLYLWVSRSIVEIDSFVILVPFLAFPAVYWNLVSGQNGLLTAALFGAATLFIDRNATLTGICFGLICYKPQMGLLIPIALGFGGYWRVFVSTSVTVLLLCGVSLLLFGFGTWHAFIINTATLRDTYAYGVIAFKGFLSPFGAARLLGGSVELSSAVQLAAAAAAALFVAWAWYRRLSLPIRAAALISGTLIAFPTIFYYDLVLDGVAAAWLFQDGESSRVEKTVMAALLLLLVYAMPVADWFPVVAVIAWVFTALVAARAIREASRRDWVARTATM